MSGKYVPMLRWKRGERTGLKHLTSPCRTDSTPYFLLGGDNFKDKKATKNTAALNAATRFADDLQAAWGPSPFYLDASPIPALPSGQHPLIDISAAVRALGGKMIPATTINSTTSYTAAVKAANAIDNLGVCLRVTLAEMTALAGNIAKWQFPLSDTDLIIDLGNNVESVLALGGAVDAVFLTLHAGSSWRTVTLAGTSIPDNFSGLPAGKHIHPRSEAKLWSQLISAGLPYKLRYGDYATVSTATPAPGIAWGYPITVKYTLPSEYLVCRGVRTTGIAAVDMDIQLVQHANLIKGHTGRSPISTCWADGEIDKVATKLKGPQGLEHWVSIGVNRHIELICSVLP